MKPYDNPFCGFELEQVRTREEELEAKEQEISLKWQALDDLENDIKDRNGVLEIVVRLNEKEQKIALQLQNLKAVQSDQVETDLNFEREKELEEKEQELFLRQRELEEREFEIDEKNDVLDMAIQVKDFRKVNIKEHQWKQGDYLICIILNVVIFVIWKPFKLAILKDMSQGSEDLISLETKKTTQRTISVQTIL